MGQIIKALNNLDQVAPYSFLSNTEAIGAGTIRVKNINAFSASWAVQIGKTGEEQAEIKMLGTATPSGTALVLVGTTLYEHPTDTPIYSIKYDQIVFERSTSGTAGTATPITDGTITITPDSFYTQFDDADGATTYAYRTYYRNSVGSAVTSESDWLTSAGFSFYCLAKLRERVKNKVTNANFIGNDNVIDDWVNEWLEVMNNKAINVNKDYSLGTVDVAFGTSGLGTITSSDYKEVRRFWVTYDGGASFVESTKMAIIDYLPNQIFNQSHPYFNFQGDNIFQIHPSDTAGTARLVYYKLTPVLVNDTDELPVSMHSYTKSFVDYGLAQAYYLDGKDTKAAKMEANAGFGLSSFINEITPRSKTGPQFITIVEETSNDTELEVY